MSDLRKAAETALETLRLFAVEENEKGMVAIKAIIKLSEALAQPEWVGLTDEEIAQIPFLELVETIQAKLKEKNT